MAIFRNFNVFFRFPIFSCKKNKFWKFWEILLFCLHWTSNWLTVSVAVDIKLAKLSCFQKLRFLSRKNHLVFQNPIFRIILLIQSTCGKFATFSHLTKQFKIFSRETHLLFKNKTNFERFEKPYSFIRFLQQNCYPQFFSKNSKFFRKSIYFYKEAQTLWTFWENYQFQFKLKSNFIAKPLQLFYNSERFERFERSYPFSCILQQS